MSDTGDSVRRGCTSTASGEIHYAMCGAGSPVLFLHQTPRSWDEFRHVLPLVGQRHLAIAMDTVGFGESAKPTWTPTIERYAEAVVQFLDSLELASVVAVGHHTGGVIAVELAASHPERVERLILSSTPLVDEAFRQSRVGKPYLDDFTPRADGSHLIELWRQRMDFYPPNRPELLDRFVLDALKAGEHSRLGHAAVAAYHMEDALPKIRCPTLIVAAPKDPFAFPHARPLGQKLRQSTLIEIPGGMVPLPDQLPEEFARATLDFIGSS